MTNFVWIDGHYIASNDAKIAALSQTIHYGFGVYEGLRSYETAHGAAIFRLQDHIKRLFQSASLLGINIPYQKETLESAASDLLQKNNFKNAYIRPVVFMGDEYLGLHTKNSSVHVMIASIKWDNFYMGKERLKQGITLKTSSYERLLLKNGLNKAKANGLYLISILANNEAQNAGFHEALLLDPYGYVAEGSGANLFMVKDNCLYTPHLNFALDGITRKTIIEIAKNNDIAVVEKNITLDELYQADEIFFTGTVAEVLPIIQIDNQTIATGKIGKITEKMQQCYLNIATARDPHYYNWLSFINGILEIENGIE